MLHHAGATGHCRRLAGDDSEQEQEQQAQQERQERQEQQEQQAGAEAATGTAGLDRPQPLRITAHSPAWTWTEYQTDGRTNNKRYKLGWVSKVVRGPGPGPRADRLRARQRSPGSASQPASESAGRPGAQQTLGMAALEGVELQPFNRAPCCHPAGRRVHRV